ncbi:MAG: CRP-like cAMP-binding protein [Paraglaciecola sp.]
MRKYGAVEKHLEKGEMLVQKGEHAVFFYQILAGVVKMNNYNDEGQETIQGIFKDGQNFGEPAVLGDFVFPANVVAVEKTQLICLEKNRFFDFLKENRFISLELLKILSKRLRFKAILSKKVKGFDAEHQIMTLLQYLKKNANQKWDYAIDMTRQMIANLIGLRVETVIRTLKTLEKAEKVKIRNQKLFI